MNREQVVTRARSAIGQATLYVLGKGGMHPTLAHPADNANACDCSGFASWCLGVSRWVNIGHPWLGTFPSDWISTTSVYDDAKKTLKCFRLVLDPLPGDLIVYPDGGGSQGHVGVLGTVADGGPVSVIHCSHGNMKVGTQDAIQETPLAPFWKNKGAIYARPIMFAEHPQDEGFA